MGLLVSILPLSATLLVAAVATERTTAQPLEISGTLELSDGARAGGLTVELTPLPTSYSHHLHGLTGQTPAAPVDSVTTSADGSYRLSVPHPGLWALRIRPRRSVGVAVATIRRDLLPLIERSLLPPITVPERRSLVVEVRSPQGLPVADALVVARLLEAELHDPAHGRGLLRVDGSTTRTGKDGIARLSLPAGKVRVRVLAAGHPLAGQDSSSDRVQVTLKPGDEHTVEVVDAGGRSIPEALILIDDPPVPLALADEAGRATVFSQATRQIAFHAETRSGHYGSSQIDPTTSDRGENVPIRIQVEPLETIRGEIADAVTEEAVARALVWSRWRPADSARSSGIGSSSLSTRSGSDGLGLEIVAPGYVPASLVLSNSQLRLGEEHALALIPAVALEGIVIDEGGRPIAGAILVAKSEESRAWVWGHRNPLVANTDSSGAFRIAGLVPGATYTLNAAADGFPPRRIELPSLGRERVEVVLSDGAEVWGEVVDSAGLPLSGASVGIRPAPDRSRLYSKQADYAEATTTDVDGHYRITALAPGHYDLQASQPGFAPRELVGIELAEGAEGLSLGKLVLEPGTVVAGRIVDRHRDPLPGASVELFRHRLDRSRSEPSEATTTRSDGTFAFDALRPDEQVALRVRHPDLATTEVHGVRAPTEEPIEIVLDEGATLTGRVVDQQGDAVAQARVRMYRGPRIDPARLRLPADRSLSTISDTEGVYTIARLAPGLWTADAGSPGLRRGRTAVFELSAGETYQLDILVETMRAVSGRVTGPNGEPVVGAEIHFGSDSAARSSIFGFGVTDAGGHYQGLTTAGIEKSGGLLEIVATHPEYLARRQRVVLRPGDNVIDLTLDRGWEIRGRVIDTAGSPVAGARLAYRRLRPQASYQQKPPALSDSGGDFVIGGLDDGAYRLSASGQGYTETTLDRPLRVAGRSLDGVELVLSDGGTVRGKVLGLDSDQVRWVAVEAHKIRFGIATDRQPPVGVDFEGFFQLENLPLGEWWISALLEYDGRSVRRQVRLEGDGAEAYVELEFGGGHTLSGIVIREGSPLAGVTLRVRDDGLFERKATTDQLGAFRLEGLTAGNYLLQALPRDGSRHLRRLELLGDDEIVVELRSPAVIEGTVVDDALEMPIPSVHITARQEGTSRSIAPQVAESENDGSFRLSLEPGRWELQIEHGGYAAKTVIIRVADGDRLSGLQLRLSPGRGTRSVDQP